MKKLNRNLQCMLSQGANLTGSYTESVQYNEENLTVKQYDFLIKFADYIDNVAGGANLDALETKFKEYLKNKNKNKNTNTKKKYSLEIDENVLDLSQAETKKDHRGNEVMFVDLRTY